MQKYLKCNFFQKNMKDLHCFTATWSGVQLYMSVAFTLAPFSNSTLTTSDLPESRFDSFKKNGNHSNSNKEWSKSEKMTNIQRIFCGILILNKDEKFKQKKKHGTNSIF